MRDWDFTGTVLYLLLINIEYMKTKYFYLLLVTALFLFSCQKEISSENNGTTPPPPSSGGNDSTVLSMYLELDTNGVSIDTLDKTIFEYDALKRITAFKSTEYAYNAPKLNINVPTEAGYFYYNGSDTLPYKTIEVAIDYYGNNDFRVDSSISFLTRNASQQVIRDSVYYFKFIRSQGAAQAIIHTSTSNYTIYADSVIENNSELEIVSGSIANQVISKNKYVQTKVNGNLLTENCFLFDNNAYRLLRSATYSYDSKINPLKILSTNYPVSLPKYFSNNSYFFPNNFTSVIGTDNTVSPVYVDAENYTYIYNTSGYPKTVAISNPTNSVYDRIGIFFYTK